MSEILAIPGGYALFCDDVRTEDNGKHLIIGAYDTQMIIWGEAPVTLPGLCVQIRFRERQTDFPRPVTFRFTKHTSGASEEISRVQINIQDSAKKPAVPVESEHDARIFALMGLTHRLADLEFTEETKIRVHALVGDDEIWLGSLQVNIQSLPAPTSDGEVPST